MDPSTLLDVPSFGGLGHPQSKQPDTSFAWGHKVEYKSLSLSTLPDNRAPQTSTRRFKADDTRNTLTRYDEVQGTKSNPLPYCRVQATGYHDTKLFPKEPYQKPEVEKAWCRPGPTKPPRLLSSLNAQDIDGATASLPINSRFSRHTNPVEPVYQLSAYSMDPVPEAKFLRDSIECKDITADLQRKLFVSEKRETNLNVKDIPGTTSRQLHRERHGTYSTGYGTKVQPTDQLQVADIAFETKKLPYHFKESARNTNPLDPQYRYNVPAESWIHSRLTGEVPKEVSQQVKDDWYIGPVADKLSLRFSTGATLKSTPGLNGDITYREYMLKTEDIDGTHTDTKGRLGLARTTAFYRTQEGRSNYVGDVDGAHPRGPFTLLPGHLMTKRLQQAQAASAGTPGNLNLNATGSVKPAPQLSLPVTTALLAAGQNGTPRGTELTATPPKAGATPRSEGARGSAPSLRPVPVATQRGRLGGSTPRQASVQATPKAVHGTPRAVQPATPRGVQGTPRSTNGGKSQRGSAAVAVNTQLLAALSS